MSGAHPFLSDAWIEAARGIHDEFADQVDAPVEAVRLNVTVTDAPHSGGTILGHLDTTTGSLIPELGHLDDPDLAITLPYAIARQLLVEQQFEEFMIFFMSGEIEVEGDVTRVMDLTEIDATPEQQELAERVATRLGQITS